MKKLGLFCMLLMVVAMNLDKVQAEEYTNYQEIIFDNDDVILLKNYSSKDFKNYYKKTKKSKMFGWRIHVVHKNEPLDFIAETKIKIYNAGTTAITQSIELDSEETYKKQISASGEIKVHGSGTKKKFKGSVDSSIKASISTTSTKSSSESYDFNIKVDPRTYVSIVIRGTGEINNGVGSYYFFWIRTKKGGWETFTVMTEYYEIIKETF